jgi:hypothetical protein
MLLDETWVFANASDTKMWSNRTRQSGRKTRSETSTEYITVHDGTRNKLVSATSLIFLPGGKLRSSGSGTGSTQPREDN